MENTVRVERAILDITQQDLAIAVGVSRQIVFSRWKRTIDSQEFHIFVYYGFEVE